MGSLKWMEHGKWPKYLWTLGPANAGEKLGNRFEKGQSGNPAGRPAGSRNKATLLLDKLTDDEAELIGGR